MELYLILLGLYMFTGLVMFEWAWAKMAPFRNVDETRDSQFPAYRRYDVKNWRKWKFYFGAVTLMPLRLILSVLTIFLLFLFIK
jgi:hypothetical protein